MYLQASLSRPESALGLQDLFSPTAAAQQGLSLFQTPPHPPPSGGFELESPRTSFGAPQHDPLASPHLHHSAHHQACDPLNCAAQLPAHDRYDNLAKRPTFIQPRTSSCCHSHYFTVPPRTSIS